jgi:hypothetical protein
MLEVVAVGPIECWAIGPFVVGYLVLLGRLRKRAWALRGIAVTVVHDFFRARSKSMRLSDLAAPRR